MGRENPSRTTSADRRSAVDRTLDAISNRRRRNVLYLLEEGGSMAVESLADDLLRIEPDSTPEGYHDDDSNPMITTLHHNHLPRLDELGFIDYDQRSGDIRLRDPPDEFREVVEVVKGLEAFPAEDVDQGPR